MNYSEGQPKHFNPEREQPKLILPENRFYIPSSIIGENIKGIVKELQ